VDEDSALGYVSGHCPYLSDGGMFELYEQWNLNPGVLSLLHLPIEKLKIGHIVTAAN
jgi:hypothetical protein